MINAFLKIPSNESIQQDKSVVNETTGVDLPWMIDTFEDGSSAVLGFRLGHSTLQDVVDKYARPTSMGLFIQQNKPVAIEAYYKQLQGSSLKAKLIILLQVDDDEMRQIQSRSMGRQGTDSDQLKLLLANADKKLMYGKIIESLTYIPAYKGLDRDYFSQRVGPAFATLQESETAVSWFYPEKGLSLLINDEGEEVFQYSRPDTFKLPENAILQK